MRTAAVVATTCALFSVAAAAAPRVALFMGGGTAPTSAGNLSAVFSNMAAAGTITWKALETEADVAALSNAAFDLVVFPGGGGGGEAGAIGADGAAAVQAFVRAGGGYYGTCAGGYLASTAACCDVPIAGFCNGATGCLPSSYGLGLINLGVAEPWSRGHGYVDIIYTQTAVAALRLPPSYATSNTSLLYYQGPIADRKYAGNNFTSGATFLSEISTGHTQFTKGQMVNTPALMMTTFGKGRVLISSPHPEETVPRLDAVVEAYTLWAAKAI